ncbi:hypothetical protein PROCOU_14628, partial [Listeria rocourtiae FSL F6-920]
SLLVSGAYVLLALAISTAAAYVLAKFQFRGANLIFFIVYAFDDDSVTGNGDSTVQIDVEF